MRQGEWDLGEKKEKKEKKENWVSRVGLSMFMWMVELFVLGVSAMTGRWCRLYLVNLVNLVMPHEEGIRKMRTPSIQLSLLNSYDKSTICDSSTPPEDERLLCVVRVWH